MTSAVPSTNRAPLPSSLADVLDLVLDKGIVVDAYVRLSVIGIELLTVDARIVIASVDTYLRFAEAVNRLDIEPNAKPPGLPTLMNEAAGEAVETAAEHIARRKLQPLADKAREVLSPEPRTGERRR